MTWKPLSSLWTSKVNDSVCLSSVLQFLNLWPSFRREKNIKQIPVPNTRKLSLFCGIDSSQLQQSTVILWILILFLKFIKWSVIDPFIAPSQKIATLTVIRPSHPCFRFLTLSLDNWVYCILWESGKWQFSEAIPFWQSLKNPKCKSFLFPYASNWHSNRKGKRWEGTPFWGVEQ